MGLGSVYLLLVSCLAGVTVQLITVDFMANSLPWNWGRGSSWLGRMGSSKCLKNGRLVLACPAYLSILWTYEKSSQWSVLFGAIFHLHLDLISHLGCCKLISHRLGFLCKGASSLTKHYNKVLPHHSQQPFEGHHALYETERVQHAGASWEFRTHLISSWRRKINSDQGKFIYKQKQKGTFLVCS